MEVHTGTLNCRRAFLGVACGDRKEIRILNCVLISIQPMQAYNAFIHTFTAASAGLIDMNFEITWLAQTHFCDMLVEHGNCKNSKSKSNPWAACACILPEHVAAVETCFEACNTCEPSAMPLRARRASWARAYPTPFEGLLLIPEGPPRAPAAALRPLRGVHPPPLPGAASSLITATLLDTARFRGLSVPALALGGPAGAARKPAAL